MHGFVSGKVLEARVLTRRGGAAVLSSDGQAMHITKLFDGVGEVFDVVGMEPGGEVGEDVCLAVQINLREYNGQKQLSLWLEGRVPSLPTFTRPPRDLDRANGGPVNLRGGGNSFKAEGNGAAAAAPALAGAAGAGR